MSLMCCSKAEQTLMDTAVLAHIREVLLKAILIPHFGQLAYNTNTKPE